MMVPDICRKVVPSLFMLVYLVMNICVFNLIVFVAVCTFIDTYIIFAMKTLEQHR
jgi:hypothetical protein